jgi:hypothetical protein
VPLGSYHRDNENGRFLIHTLRGHGGIFGPARKYLGGIIKVDTSGAELERGAAAANQQRRRVDRGLYGL